MAKLLCFKDLDIFLGVAINRDAAIKREMMIYMYCRFDAIYCRSVIYHRIKIYTWCNNFTTFDNKTGQYIILYLAVTLIWLNIQVEHDLGSY